ncbi:MAG: hypothetical protein H2212_03610 [Ruminococcus sp.]|nr:hypothetical protein [Ruminococcus sp.]
MIILHKGNRVDNNEEVRGYLTMMWGQFHIVMENDENTAYPVLEKTISPCFEGTPLQGIMFVNLRDLPENSRTYTPPNEKEIERIEILEEKKANGTITDEEENEFESFKLKFGRKKNG